MKNVTDISILLDNTGSMFVIRDKTISGFNEFLVSQQTNGVPTEISLIKFNSDNYFDVKYWNSRAETVLPLTREDYYPTGTTPLLDALGTLINKKGDMLSNLHQAERPSRVVIVVITDGEENASSEFNFDKIKEMVKHQTEIYSWQFVFLGADIDSFAQSAGVGIPSTRAANYKKDNIIMACKTVGDRITAYSASSNSADLDWTESDRKILMGETSGNS